MDARPGPIPACPSLTIAPTGVPAQPPSRKRLLLVAPAPTKKRATSPAENYSIPAELGECICQDVELLQRVGWPDFFKMRRNGGDLSDLTNIKNHPAKRLLRHYKHRGVPVKFYNPPWNKSNIAAALAWGTHKSCNEHIGFLNEEFVDMIHKGKWVFLPAAIAQELEGLRLSPPGVVPQQYHRLRCICNYIWSGVNHYTLPLAAMETMQIGHSLKSILREILLANPAHGPVMLNKTDLSNGFYCMDVNPDDAPNLGVVFPTNPGANPMVAVPFVLPMGWKNSPPTFSAAMETITNVANSRLRNPNYTPPPHRLDHMVAEVLLPPKTISLAQDPQLCRFHQTLLYTVDHVFLTLGDSDSPF